MANLLLMTQRQYRYRNTVSRPPNALGVLSLTREFDLDTSSFVQGRTDWPSLIKRISGKRDSIPARYTRGALSRRRTTLHVLSYLERTRGSDYVYDLLRKFGITEAAFQDPDEYININLITDITAHLGSLGATQETFFAMGMESARINKNVGYSQSILQGLKIKDAFAFQINHLMGYFDRNHQYKIGTLKENSCTIETRQSKESLEALHVFRHGNESICALRAGVAASFPLFFGLPAADARDTHCVHRGDPICVCEVDFSAAATAQRETSLI
jgi:hypothetical protein